MSNTTAATLAQNEVTLIDQEFPSERLDPENNERMSVVKIGRMRKHLSVKITAVGKGDTVTQGRCNLRGRGLYWHSTRP